MSHQSIHLYEFGPFRLDAGERLLLRDGESVPLTPKSFDLLLALVEHHGHLLEKDELMKLIWPDTFVEEANLSYNISLIRKALGDGENGHKFIETAPKRGYRFVAEVREAEGKRAEPNLVQSPGSLSLANIEDGAATQTAAAGPSVMAQALTIVLSVRWLWLVAGVGLLAMVALSAFLIGRRVGSAPGGRAAQTPPSFQRLTFRLGRVWSARFAPDGQTIIYGGTWEGDKHQLYQTRPESSESRPLGQLDADILAISSSGEMALALQPSHLGAQIRGTLGLMPLAGSAPRPILQDVLEADWSPDGTRLAVVRAVGGRRQVEFPLGASLYESNLITRLRISPKGDSIAFIEDKTLVVVDLAGKKKTLSSGWRTIESLAWSPGGDEVWFTASEVGFRTDLYAVTLSGEQRVVLRAPDQLRLEDISRDGRALLRRLNFRKGMMGLPPGEKQERDLSWLDWGHATDLSADGKILLFDESGEGGGFTEPGGGAGTTVYLRKMDGSPAVRLGEGATPMLSPDGKWVVAIRRTRPIFRVALLPTGVGEAKTLTDDPISCGYASWFPDGKRILIVGTEPGHSVRNYIRDLGGGKPRPITPEGIAGRWLSPDGQWIIAGPMAPEYQWYRTGSPEYQPSLFPVAGGKPRPIPGLSIDDEPIRWSGDGRSIYVRQRVKETAQARVYRLDMATGRREMWKEYEPDPSQTAGGIPLALTPDGKSYAYTYIRNYSDLYMVKGLK